MATPEVILSMEGITQVYGSGHRAVTALENVRLVATDGVRNGAMSGSRAKVAQYRV